MHKKTLLIGICFATLIFFGSLLFVLLDYLNKRKVVSEIMIMPNILPGSIDKLQFTLESVIDNTSALNLPYTKTELMKYLGKFEFLFSQ